MTVSALTAFALVWREPVSFAPARPRLAQPLTGRPSWLGSRRATPEAPTLYWQFSASARAEDDPQAGRSFMTLVTWQGERSSACAAGPTLLAQQAELMADQPVHVERETVFCLPGCANAQPPLAQRFALAHKVDMLAGQEAFDRAPAEFSPSGEQTLVQWSCAGRQYRITATAAAALACNSPGCDDLQVANVAVALQADAGRALDEPAVLLPWEDTGHRHLMGQMWPEKVALQ